MTKIPKFDRREVDAARMTYSGAYDSDDILHVGDEIVQVVRGRVGSVAFKENQFGVMRRVHSIKIDHAMPADEDAARELAAEIKRQQDAESGQASLDEQLDTPEE